MGHTNSTANIALPQFIGTDKPTWLGDVNGAFSAIDSKVGTIDADIAATDAKADTAISDAAAAVTTATNANNTAGTASTTATQANNIANNALTVANNADGHTNQLEMKVGLLADLTTTNKTSIVNAINEVNGAIGTPTASQVSYDNSGSGLTATNVQDAIDEVAQGGGSGSWTLLGTQTGNTPIAEPATYTEIYATIDADNSHDFIADFYILKASFAGNDYTFRRGYYLDSTHNGDVRFNYDSGAFKIGGVYKNGSDKTSTSVITIYYR